MRVSLRLVGISAAVCFAFALAAAACSSSSPSAGGADASSEAASDAAVGDEDGGSSPTCYIDASLSAFAASDASAAGCAACVQASCHPAITTCETDCTCINFFTCLADSGVATSGLGSSGSSVVNMCAGSAVLTVYNDPGVKGLADCLSDTCATACSGILDAGSVDDDATPEAGASIDASPDAGSDAGSPVDAAIDGD
jgi:hypothetical protein